MAIKATIFKAELQVSDMDRHYYQDHLLTIARHPSENDARMMLRLFAFALHAHERLALSKGMSSDEEPDIWQKSLSDEVEVWIDLGQPDEKRLRQACGRAKSVVIYTYHERSALLWWQSVQSTLSRFKQLKVILIPDVALQAMAQFSQRSMQLQYTIQDGEVLISNGEEAIQVIPSVLK